MPATQAAQKTFLVVGTPRSARGFGKDLFPALMTHFLVHSQGRSGAEMKAIRFHEFGGPEVLKYEDVPDPKPRKDQVLVRVKACALNHVDLFIRKGLPGIKLP